MGVMYGRWLCPFILVLPHNLSKQCILSHAGTLPWRFSVHCEMNMETIVHSRRTIRFLLFFLSFLHAQKRTAGVDLCHSVELQRVPVIAYLAPSINLAFKSQSISAMDWYSRMHAPPRLLLGLVRDRAMTWDTLLEICSLCKHRSAIGRTFFPFFLFFFFLLLLSIAQRIGSKPPHSHMKVFSCVRDVWTFEMTP